MIHSDLSTDLWLKSSFGPRWSIIDPKAIEFLVTVKAKAPLNLFSAKFILAGMTRSFFSAEKRKAL